MSQPALFDIPEDKPKGSYAWRADSVANFNLLAYGDYQKAIDEIEKDIAAT